MEAHFYNPYPAAHGDWISGFLFRNPRFNWLHAVIITSAGDWYHHLRMGSDNEDRLGVGYSQHIDTSADGSNLIRIIAIGDEGALFVNGHHVTNLDLSGFTEAGHVHVVGDGGSGHGVKGKSTRFEDFTIRTFLRDDPPSAGTLRPTATPRPTSTPLPTTTPAQATAPSLIAFSSERDGNWEIYVMNVDGSDQTRLTNNEADDGFPSWSPDGQRIAFRSNRDGNFEIYVMNADGSSQTRLTNNEAFDANPSWSPDGRRLAFFSNRDGNLEIYVMNADGSDQTRLTDNEARDTGSSWSPDGRRLVFFSNRDDPDPNDDNSIYNIYVMNADGSGQTRLTDNEAWDIIPSWSPDGRHITFLSDRDDPDPNDDNSIIYNIYMMNADGSDQTRLTNNEAWDGSSSWSPNGRRIAYDSNQNGNWEIYIMNTDGSGQTRLTDNEAIDISPSWSAGR